MATDLSVIDYKRRMVQVFINECLKLVCKDAKACHQRAWEWSVEIIHSPRDFLEYSAAELQEFITTHRYGTHKTWRQYYRKLQERRLALIDSPLLTHCRPAMLHIYTLAMECHTADKASTRLRTRKPIATYLTEQQRKKKGTKNGAKATPKKSQ